MFKGHCFPKAIILQAVYFKLRFSLSYRDVEELLSIRGVKVDHATIQRWVTKSTPDKVMGIGGIDYWKDGRETFDNTHLIFSYPNGVKAKFTCLTSNSMNDYKIKVMGDKGTIILDYSKAWFYPEGKNNKEIGEVDGVSGATMKWDEGKGYPLNVDHENPSKQALQDFRDSIVNNTAPISNVITGANTSICVQMGLDAMYKNEIVHWKSHTNL